MNITKIRSALAGLATAAMVATPLIVGTTSASAEVPQKSWAGAYINWKAESGTNHRNLRYDCDSDHSDNYLMAPQERNLCASTPSEVTVYFWVPDACHWDTSTLFGWRNSGKSAGHWHVYDRGLTQTTHRYGTC